MAKAPDMNRPTDANYLRGAYFWTSDPKLVGIHGGSFRRNQFPLVFAKCEIKVWPVFATLLNSANRFFVVFLVGVG